MPRIDPKDRRAQGDPETVVYLPQGAGSLVGLYIKGVGAGTMLGIREDVTGQPVSCAVTNRFESETPIQSNPRRPPHGYGAVRGDEDHT